MQQLKHEYRNDVRVNCHLRNKIAVYRFGVGTRLICTYARYGERRVDRET